MEFQVPEPFILKIPSTKLNQKTVHGYAKNEIISSLKKSLLKSQIELANYLTAELVASGFYLNLWDLIWEILTQNLMGLLSPKLIAWLLHEYKYFNTLRNKYHQQILNHQEIRNHLSQVVSILCLCPKNPLVLPGKSLNIKVDQKSLYLAREYLLLSKKNPDNEEKLLNNLLNPLSFFIYHVNHNQMQSCLYWIHQIVQIKNIQIKPLSTFKAPKSLSSHPSWIIWDYILIRAPPFLKVYLDNIISLFIINLNRKKILNASYLLFNALLTIKYQNEINLDLELPRQAPSIIQIVGKINLIYQNLTKYPLLT